MRLLVVTNDYPPRPGGIQQYLGSLLAAYPHPARVLAPADPEAAAADAAAGVEVVRHRSRFLWPTPAIRRWIEAHAADFGPDAIFFGAPTPLPTLGPSLRRRLGVPYAVLSHGAEITLPAVVPGLRGLVAGPLRRADALFANGRFTARRVSALTGRTVTVLGGGVDLAAFHPGPPPFPGGRRPVVGCVSRFVPRKGQQRLLAAAAQVRAAGLDLEVLLVGKGRTEPALRRRADQLGVPTRFEVGVPWERLGELYREMDVFCMPCRSRWGGLEVEGLGLVYLEAAATGIPVLAGDSGGAPETVDPGRTGYVVHDVADIAEALVMLLSDPAAARAMGRAGRERVEREWTWDLAAGRLIAAWGTVV